MNSEKIKVVKITDGKGNVYWERQEDLDIGVVVEKHPCPISLKYMEMPTIEYGLLRVRADLEHFFRTGDFTVTAVDWSSGGRS